MDARNNRIIKKKYMQFFISMFVSVLFLQFTTIIDTMIVGNLVGTSQMSGIRVSAPVINMISTFSTLIGVGCGMVISISLGKRNTNKANACFTLSLFLTVIIGLLVTIFAIFLTEPITNLITSDKSIIEYTKAYMKIVLMSGPFFLLAAVMGYIIRSDGYIKLSMAVLITGGLMNVLFDLIFILGFNLGVEGAAYATSLSYIISSLVSFSYFFIKKRSIHFTNIFKSNDTKSVFISTIKSGLPATIRLLFYNISMLIINFFVGKYLGTIGIAVCTVCANVGLLTSIVFQSSGAAMMPVMGVLIGEKDYKGIKLLISHVLKMTIIMVLVIMLVVVLIASVIFPLFGIKNIGEEYILVLRLYVIGFIFVALNYILIFYFTGLQKLFLALLIPFLENILFSIPLVIITTMNVGIHSIELTYILSEFFAFVITIIVVLIYKKKKNYSSLYLLPNEDSNLLLDFSSIINDINAVNVSEEVSNILANKNVDLVIANRIAVLLEEILVNIKKVKRNDKMKLSTDIRIIENKDGYIISLRTDGYPFNPLIVDDEDISIRLIKDLAIKINVRQIVGFNQIIIEV